MTRGSASTLGPTEHRLTIVPDDLRGAAIAAFLADHLREMRAVSPPESTHALDLDALRQPAITFWVVRDGDALAGCIALKALDGDHVEIKSMRVAPTHRRFGVARRLLDHVLDEATRRGCRRISLETGAMAFFEPARTLYAQAGFEVCPAFGDYREDPNSVFMSRALATRDAPAA
jgi:putative acetyltransferase